MKLVSASLSLDDYNQAVELFFERGRPFHVERGRAPGSDAATVFACEGPNSVFCYGSPEEMLHVPADSMQLG